MEYAASLKHRNVFLFIARPDIDLHAICTAYQHSQANLSSISSSRLVVKVAYVCVNSETYSLIGSLDSKLYIYQNNGW